MNHCVPDFETDDDYLFPASTNSKRHKKSAMGDEDIMELLWQNGQVVMQSQNQRSAGIKTTSTASVAAAGREIRSGGIDDETTPCSNLFMQEDEMVSWLHYPSDENSLDLYLNHNNDILFPVLPPPSTTSVPPPLATAPRPPPVPPLRRVEEEEPPSAPKFANFLHFSRPNNCNNSRGGLTLTGSGASNANQVSQAVTQSTVVESNIGCRGSTMSSFGAGTSSAGTGREPETCDLSASSSPGTGGSGASANAEPSRPAAATDDRKRKGRDTDDTECYSEELEFEYHDPKKKSRGSSSSTKRSRAAEVHNLSERRRRDRINEKMKALQELIPRCNKSDKASMLDEAIEYLKSLQMQVQMMSMGYSMVPMMFPGVQRYMPAMAAMGMGIDPVGMNRGMVPYPSVLPGPPLPNSAAHLGQRFPVPRFQMAQMANPSDPMMNSFPPQNANQPRGPFADPYQHCLGLPQTQLPQQQQQHQQQQNQTGMPAVTSKPSSSKDVRYPQRHPTG